MFFDENVALFHVDAKTDEEAISLAAKELHERGIVKDTFFENVMKREREYPTGCMLAASALRSPTQTPNT